MGVRLGIFGGTFDPPHVGHRAVVQEVAEVLELDEVLWVPTGDPPHKDPEGLTPAPIRLRMVRALTAGEPRFRVSEIEVRRDGPSYTVDTLRAIRERNPDADLLLIMGFDQYRAFDSWHRPEEVRGLARLVVMDRGGEGVREGDGHETDPDIIRVPVERIDLSSTRVRSAVDRGESISRMVTPEVARIIEAEGLYRRHGD